MIVEPAASVSRFDYYLPQALVLLGLLFTYVQLRRERKKEIIDQATTQALRHQENISRLDALKEFQTMQIQLNRSNDMQLNELKIQTAKLTAIVEGQNRRLILLEDR